MMVAEYNKLYDYLGLLYSGGLKSHGISTPVLENRGRISIYGRESAA